ncbi:MAG: hypothetical protein PQ975_00135 [Methanobacterium sp.]
MLEFIIRTIILVIIVAIGASLLRYINKMPLNKSINEGLFIGFFITVGATAYNPPAYQLTGLIDTIKFIGPIVFLLVIYRYFISNLPLKDSIRKGLITGLIAGIVLIVLPPMLAKSIDFFIGLIV